jgi:hypothetical protein
MLDFSAYDHAVANLDLGVTARCVLDFSTYGHAVANLDLGVTARCVLDFSTYDHAVANLDLGVTARCAQDFSTYGHAVDFCPCSSYMGTSPDHGGISPGHGGISPGYMEISHDQRVIGALECGLYDHNTCFGHVGTTQNEQDCVHACHKLVWQTKKVHDF